MKVRVAVVYGGRSGEHEISLRSDQSIMDAMDPEKYRVIQYRISKEGKWSPKPISPEPGGNPEIDVVFPVLHGTFGEDGTVQGLLELADLAYVGAGVLASAVAMDKEVMKRLAVERGLPVVEYRVWPTARCPTRGASVRSSNTVDTRPVFFTTVMSSPSLTPMPAASCPRCCRAYSPR